MLDILMYVAATIFFIFVSLRLWQDKKQQDSKFGEAENIPGPLSLPFLGTRWQFTIGRYSTSKIPEYYEEMRNKYGTIFKEEDLFNIPVISVFEKGDIEKVLKSSGKYPLRPPSGATAKYRREHPEKYASIGLANEQGATWHFLRTALTSVLTSPKTINDFLPQMEEIVDEWCHLIKQKMKDDGHINNLEELAGKLGLEAICALILGRRMGFLIEDQKCGVAKKLSDAVQQNLIACRDTYYVLPFWKLFPTPAYKRLCNSEKSIYECASELIRTADDSTRESAIFQSVLNANIDEREKKSAIVDLLGAGIHTFKNTLLLLLYHIAINPEYQEKIVQDTTKAYLKAFTMETYRLSPTVTSLARIINCDMVLSGYHLSAGTVVICQTSLACQHESNFKDAKKFRPERWFNEEKKETGSSTTFLVIPFGYGKRICPGKRYMEQMLPMILEKMVRMFVISVDKPMELEYEFLMSPKGHVSMNFKDRV